MDASLGRRPALAIERCDRDLESVGDNRRGVRRDLGHPGLDAPDLEPGHRAAAFASGEQFSDAIGELLPAQLLAQPDLLDPARNERAFGSHIEDVSETETRVQSFQTRKRKHAITLAGFMTKLIAPDMEVFEKWAAQLGVSFEKVLKKAGVSDPDEARASRSRMRKGGAPRVRQQLFEVLAELERQRSEPTEMGAVLIGLSRWQELGAELAELEPQQFLDLLAALRKRVEVARDAQRAAAPFFESQPSPARRRAP